MQEILFGYFVLIFKFRVRHKYGLHFLNSLLYSTVFKFLKNNNHWLPRCSTIQSNSQRQSLSKNAISVDFCWFAKSVSFKFANWLSSMKSSIDSFLSGQGKSKKFHGLSYELEFWQAKTIRMTFFKIFHSAQNRNSGVLLTLHFLYENLEHQLLFCGKFFQKYTLLFCQIGFQVVRKWQNIGKYGSDKYWWILIQNLSFLQSFPPDSFHELLKRQFATSWRVLHKHIRFFWKHPSSDEKPKKCLWYQFFWILILNSIQKYPLVFSIDVISQVGSH